MGIKQDYVRISTDVLCKMNPNLDRKDIEKIVRREVKMMLQDPTIHMDNNVTHDNFDTTLTEVCNWIENTNPVVAGNATFYMQPKSLQSPTSNMLRSLKVERKAVKNQMFECKEGSDEYNNLDLAQQNKKVIMNAEYGGSGTPTAAFYTEYNPPATTLFAQSLITVMAAFFECFVGDNQRFFHANECFDWMSNLLESKKGLKIPKWVIRVNDPKKVLDRICSKFEIFNINYYNPLKSYIYNCTDDELVYLYYANNMKSFIADNQKVSNLIKAVLTDLPSYEASTDNSVPAGFEDKFENASKYNKWVAEQMFLNPYKVPPVISSYMNELRDLFHQFVYVEYATPDSIVKLNNHMRNTVLLVDTDSNIINANLFVAYISDEIFPGNTFGRDRLYHDMILTNVLACILDKSVAALLDFYGRFHFIDEECRKELSMKNEYMFRRLFLMQVKKRYASSILLREGNIILPLKSDIKGVDFIKAGVTEEVSNRFKAMLENHILYSEEVELHELMKELKSFEREIYHDLKSGSTKFYKPQQFKAEGAYQKKYDSNGRETGTTAWSLPVYRGSIIWNIIYPEDKIYSLDRVKIINLTIGNLMDIEPMREKYPAIYDRIRNEIFLSSNPEIVKAGMKVIAVPSQFSQVPEWLIPYIDYDLTVSGIISSFKSVLSSLKINGITYKTPSGKANLISCLIDI